MAPRTKQSWCTRSRDSGDVVGLVPSASQLNSSHYGPRCQAGLCPLWPPEAVSFPPASIATPASKEGKVAPPCKYFCRSPKAGCHCPSLGRVLIPPRVTVCVCWAGWGCAWLGEVLALGVIWGSLSAHKKEGLERGRDYSPL